MHKKLFIPGPVEVREDVLEKMATPMIGHRSKEASKLQRDISDKMRKVFHTKEEILLSTSSGTGLLEGAIRCSTAKRAAVFSIGAFGKRWHQIAECNNVPADLYEVEWGKAADVNEIDKVLATGKYDSLCITHNETSTGVMNPIEEIAEVVKKYPDIVWCVDTVSSMGGTKIEVDKLGIDICLTSSQKALGLPPGMAICSFSKKAVERAKNVKFRGYYLDLLSIYNYIQKKDYQYPSTPSLSHMFAMDYQLDRILEEGLENRYNRHLEMAKYVREWAKKYFELFADERYLSNTLTNIKNTRDIDVAELNKKLGERGFQISNGYGKLKGKAFRIAHMADCTLDDIKELLENINEILGL
ncbi:MULTISPECIES: pyridoxal-phosphate-dependent aminotransferase family protein [Clostridium]|uniref:Predicted aminotransferase n=4 Tax=Clostridium TaxID=1485 RepID=D8GK80_CLOLD|nr:MULTISPECIES: alanine--glyoxylate aminotransferase family protein [Clostridium]ADK13198.1 predicted aminotransferase [Clostridium ljungdahlii DSM 13528]AGY76423.1 alanine--glyoxylate aminotransferase family protein [Clostridium autoethanogenum DSM 10061]ALU36586.1 Alanine-glyoxylate transaminase [Clostridium autoethanogenum DSM 10061]OAA84439.1 Soluble hydrogenase 42 kDa subunit [Clostridium ljungdahlii DSM 13528]OAA91382.1 Soluble hydrogenase 42 kDa subunit [Clostridium coskatii]